MGEAEEAVTGGNYWDEMLIDNGDASIISSSLISSCATTAAKKTCAACSTGLIGRQPPRELPVEHEVCYLFSSAAVRLGFSAISMEQLPEIP